MIFSEYILIFVAALAAGFVNAVAGGGTLITFPVLTALGIPPVAANITNTIALCPGYLGGIIAQLKDLKGQRKRLLFFLPVAVLGGISGGALVLCSGDRLFRELVPYLILIATVLLALQGIVKKSVLRKYQTGIDKYRSLLFPALLIFPASVYGGYFGAGLGVILLAVLGFTIRDTMTRINALKQTISLSTNFSAALFFLFSGQVIWLIAVIMAAGAVIGGFAGGKLAGKLQPEIFRVIVIIIGLTVGIIYLLV